MRGMFFVRNKQSPLKGPRTHTVPTLCKGWELPKLDYPLISRGFSALLSLSFWCVYEPQGIWFYAQRLKLKTCFSSRR